MSAALITAIGLSIAGLVASIVLGHVASGPADVFRHASLSVFVTLVTLLAHSMTMFYLIGKGRAIREAVTEGGLSPSFVADVARARGPVFAVGTTAVVLTMATAIIGGGVDTGAVPAVVHTLLAYAALAANLAAFRTTVGALVSIARVVNEVNRLLGGP